MSLLSYSDVDTKLLGNSIKPPMYHPITIFLLRRHSLAKIYFLDSPIWFLPFNLWSTMVQSSHSASPLAVKMSVPQNFPFSVILGKYQLVAPLPDETATPGSRLCFSFTIPNSCRSNSVHPQSSRLLAKYGKQCLLNMAIPAFQIFREHSVHSQSTHL